MCAPALSVARLQCVAYVVQDQMDFDVVGNLRVDAIQELIEAREEPSLHSSFEASD